MTKYLYSYFVLLSSSAWHPHTQYIIPLLRISADNRKIKMLLKRTATYLNTFLNINHFYPKTRLSQNVNNGLIENMSKSGFDVCYVLAGWNMNLENCLFVGVQISSPRKLHLFYCSLEYFTELRVVYTIIKNIMKNITFGNPFIISVGCLDLLSQILWNKRTFTVLDRSPKNLTLRYLFSVLSVWI